MASAMLRPRALHTSALCTLRRDQHGHDDDRRSPASRVARDRVAEAQRSGGSEGDDSGLRVAGEDFRHGVQRRCRHQDRPGEGALKGKVSLTDLDPPNGYKIVGEGEGGVAGFAKGSAHVKLSDKDGGTLLTYNVDAQIGGKLAQLGQRLINGAAKKMADEFFQKFAAAVGSG